MDKIIRKIDNDGYETEYVDFKDIADKLDELVEGYNELRENYLDLSKLFYIHLGGKEKVAKSPKLKP